MSYRYIKKINLFKVNLLLDEVAMGWNRLYRVCFYCYIYDNLLKKYESINPYYRR
jgi:hypothetical protein